MVRKYGLCVVETCNITDEVITAIWKEAFDTDDWINMVKIVGWENIAILNRQRLQKMYGSKHI